MGGDASLGFDGQGTWTRDFGLADAMGLYQYKWQPEAGYIGDAPLMPIPTIYNAQIPNPTASATESTDDDWIYANAIQREQTTNPAYSAGFPGVQQISTQTNAQIFAGLRTVDGAWGGWTPEFGILGLASNPDTVSVTQTLNTGTGAGQGTYAVDQASGQLSFTPAPGFFTQAQLDDPSITYVDAAPSPSPSPI